MGFNVKTLVRKSVVAVAGIGLPSAALFLAALADHRPLTFESQESKTRELTPVFNRVVFADQNGRDVWMMQQSHHGLPAREDLWDETDRIAIAISRDETDGTKASFLQLEPASITSIESQADLSKVAGFKAPCGMCHNNGPRAIRPNFNSTAAPLSTWEKVRVFVWNLKIKSYGRTRVNPSPSEKAGSVPFRFTMPAAGTPLTVATCTVCHRDSGPFARGTLTRQNTPSIRFMVEQGFMPPLGIPLSDRDRRALSEFIE